jgi:hypothetical protein
MKILDYERGVYSQNGEDGIIEKMVQHITSSSGVFLEIGWGDGTCNNTRALISKGWTGVGVDAMYQPHPDLLLPTNFVFKQLKVVPENLAEVFDSTQKDLDFFSLDIDSYDFVVSEWMLRQGYRPKTVCLEVNPGFGPSVCASFPYKIPDKKKIYRKQRLYGCSLMKYRKLWESYGYHFFGFETTVTNIFFYHPDFVKGLENIEYRGPDDFPVKDDQLRQGLERDAFWSRYIDEIYGE